MRTWSLTIACFLWIACFQPVSPDQGYADHHPLKVSECLESPEVVTRAGVQKTTNPYYLRGEFDGDRRADYAVDIKGLKTGRNGVLFCMGDGKVAILGGDNPINPPFSDMPNDNFVAPAWEVFSQREAIDLMSSNRKLPRREFRPRGEAIAMIWEDGIALILLGRKTLALGWRTPVMTYFLDPLEFVAQFCLDEGVERCLLRAPEPRL